MCRNFLLLARFIYRKTTKFCKFHSFVISLSETMYECRYNVRKTWKKSLYKNIKLWYTVNVTMCHLWKYIHKQTGSYTFIYCKTIACFVQVTQVISMFRTLLSINSPFLFHHNAKSLLILTLYSKLLSLVFVNIYM